MLNAQLAPTKNSTAQTVLLSEAPLPVLADNVSTDGEVLTSSRANSSPSSKLDALTTLRFFAALAILVYHLAGMFKSCDLPFLRGLALTQGVSFFFVLSGFILTYVHPSLKTSAQAKQFLLARFARIWPTHFASFLLTVMLVPPVLAIHHAWMVAAANLLLIQTWFFTPGVGASFNNVSWTISVELFFYLSFPFLIRDFDRPFKFRWVAATIVSLACIATYAVLCTVTDQHVSSGLYVVENPLARLGEFMLGMAICYLFKKRGLPSTFSRDKATILECGAIALVLLALNVGNLWAGPQQQGALWALHTLAIPMGGAPFFAVLIYLMASERGRISEFFKKKILVRLGETSFSLYMLHMAILNFAVQYQNAFSNLPGFVLPTMATVMCFIAADLNYTVIESPCRRFILSLGKRDRGAFVASSAETKSADLMANGLSKLNRKNHSFTKIVAAEIVALVLLACWMTHYFRFISSESARIIVSHSVPSARGVEFGGRFKLSGLKLSRRSDGLHIDAVWESLAVQKMTCGSVFTLQDSAGKKLSSQMFAQDNFARSISKGTLWEDKIVLSPSTLTGAAKVELSLCDPFTGPVAISRGLQGTDPTQIVLAIP